MSSRDKILAAIKNNQPDQRDLPAVTPPGTGEFSGLSRQFIEVLEGIGGRAYIVSGFHRIATILKEQYTDTHRIVSTCPELSALAEISQHYEDPHTLENVGLVVLEAHFAVAENGACWITEEKMIERALPFIAQDLALVIRRKDIVPTMYEAYERIAGAEYGFGVFIAGPSKTADIEQSLVLGAHGPKSMTVFLLDEEMSDAGFY
ncbi:LUD domain-containing protein [Flavitalea sp. BT771]|uniref:LutC/YkgG family protein n=1 Tax=Flavitalea sp. BT771 TaxID=3063329 RepID=UPI0026E12234|nr:LUD domain-containing protein [Flavitalea sp. BT771]MDO6430617.1 LUD domain-containing protein [Flavitalea sp. BT771]MDV6219243.1 LUD domain-containing protein [Flavitalea sp. BT771]